MFTVRASKSTLLIAAAAALTLSSGIAAASANSGEVRAASRSSNVTGALADPFYLRVVDHNVHADQNAINSALAKADDTAAPVIFLQEVCASQYEAIDAAHPSWSVELKPDHMVCQLPGGDTEGGGNVAIWRGGNNATRAVKTFTAQAWLPDRGFYSESGVMCLVYSVNGIDFRVCSTHLVAKEESVSAAQAVELRNFLRNKGWIADSSVTVVGGDFNMTPQSTGMDSLYSHGGGNGDFYEAHRQNDGTVCRCGNPTGTYSKIDYVFISKKVFAATSASSLTTFDTASDHMMLLGRSTLTP